MKEYYKYIHIIGHNELRISPLILQYFSDCKNNIDPDEHFFVTPHKMVYEAFSEKFSNLIYAPNHIKKRLGVVDWDGGLINEYAPRCDFLIVHRICFPYFFHSVKHEYYKKIVWRSWGGDAGLIKYSDKKYLKNTVKTLYNRFIWSNIVKQFALVGIANSVDEVDLTKRIGKVKMLHIPYPRETDYYQLLEDIKCNKSIHECHECINVMIGHSGYSIDNHLEIIDLLCRYKDEERVQFYFPLTYGDEAYIEMVKNYAIDKLGNKVHIIEKHMSYYDYANFINDMDIAIIDGLCSQALGNIGLLLFFDTKLFLNSNGIIRETFRINQIPFCDINEISRMTFAELSAPLSYDGVDKKDIVVQPRSKHVEYWNNVFSYLDGINNN